LRLAARPAIPPVEVSTDLIVAFAAAPHAQVLP